MKFLAFWHAFRNYLATPKGAHDAWDYGRALLLIALTCIAAVILFDWLWMR